MDTFGRETADQKFNNTRSTFPLGITARLSRCTFWKHQREDDVQRKPTNMV